MMAQESLIDLTAKLASNLNSLCMEPNLKLNRFSLSLLVFSQNSSSPSQKYPWYFVPKQLKLFSADYLYEHECFMFVFMFILKCLNEIKQFWMVMVVIILIILKLLKMTIGVVAFHDDTKNNALQVKDPNLPLNSEKNEIKTSLNTEEDDQQSNQFPILVI